MAALLGCTSLCTAPATKFSAIAVGFSKYSESNALRFNHQRRDTRTLRSGNQHRFLICKAAEKGKVDALRETQLKATDLLAELMKAENAELVARKHVDLLTQDFFMIASTYLSMAKKEGNAEVVNRLEAILKTAMAEREKSLRPEIQLLNQLLRDNGASERAKTLNKGINYLTSDSYFFQLLNRMVMDVEKQPSNPLNPQKMKLLSQLRAINKEAREISKCLKHAARAKEV